MSANTSSPMDELISKLGDLHTAPLVAKQLLTLTRSVDYDIKRVVECLESDPALMAKVLRIVNSSHYGISRQITSLRQAVTLIGQRSLRLIATTFSLVEGLTKGLSGQLYNAYWRNALTIATAASRLSAFRRDVNKDDAYSAGLLADLGMLVFAQMKQERYTQLLNESPQSADLVEVERDAFGFDHAQLGSRLIERWGFPEELISVLARHHADEPSEDPLGLTVQAAAALTDILWTANNPRLTRVRAMLSEHFGVGTDEFIDLAMGCREDIALQAEVLGVKFTETFDCDAILAEARQQHFELSLETALDLDSLASTFDDHST